MPTKQKTKSSRVRAGAIMVELGTDLRDKLDRLAVVRTQKTGIKTTLSTMLRILVSEAK